MRRALANTHRRPAPGQLRARSRTQTFPAPTGGLVTNVNLARPVRDAAIDLENWFPTQTGIRLRGGSTRIATLPSEVIRGLHYQSGSNERLFMATDTDIYDVTIHTDPQAAPSPVLSGLTSGDWSFVQFETAGGDFMLAVNGADTPKLFDGVAWTDANITGLDPTTLRDVWAYRNRIYFAGPGAMQVSYLSVDTIGGAAQTFSLAGVFTKGGEILFGGTWSLDAGDGIDDKWFAITNCGEVAVYEGANPNEADQWRIVGRYDITEPLGKTATFRAGGDVMVATTEGIVPLSQAVNTDIAALSLAAISHRIEPTWKEAINQRRLQTFDMLKWSQGNMAIVAAPSPNPGRPTICLVVNLETGAWTKYTGWDARALAVYQGRLYFGAGDGGVFLAENGGTDDGQAYESRYCGHFERMGTGPAEKQINLGRASFRAGRGFIPRVSGSVNYVPKYSAAPNSAPDEAADVWDSGLWDQARWDSSGLREVSTRWTSIAQRGFVFAPQLQVVSSMNLTPDAELISIDYLYESGGVAV